MGRLILLGCFLFYPGGSAPQRRNYVLFGRGAPYELTVGKN
jgi:hypothetical protein